MISDTISEILNNREKFDDTKIQTYKDRTRVTADQNNSKERTQARLQDRRPTQEIRIPVFPDAPKVNSELTPEQNNLNAELYREYRYKYLTELNQEHQQDYISASRDTSARDLTYASSTPEIDKSYFDIDNKYLSTKIECENKSINDIYAGGTRRLLPSIVSCNDSNPCTSDSNYDNFYRSRLANPPIKMYDYKVNGANYADYLGFVHPGKLNIQILSQNTKTLPDGALKHKNIPMPSNYAPGQHDPVVAMP